MYLIYSLAESYLKNKKYVSLFPKPLFVSICFSFKEGIIILTDGCGDVLWEIKYTWHFSWLFSLAAKASHPRSIS